jgi:hypothetical protein
MIPASMNCTPEFSSPAGFAAAAFERISWQFHIDLQTLHTRPQNGGYAFDKICKIVIHCQ